MRRHEEALELIRKAQELDPFSSIVNDDYGWVLYLAGKYDEAIEQYLKTIALDSSFVPAHEELGRVYMQKGMFSDAAAQFNKTMSLTNVSFNTYLAYCYATAGDKDKARSMLKNILETADEVYVSPYQIAVVFSGLGETDHALSWLQKPSLERSSGLLWIAADPEVNFLRSDPRVKTILRHMRLGE